MKKYSGFTLIELVIVIVILGIIAVASSQMLNTGLNAYITGKNIIDAGQQARLGIERMVRDIHAVRSSSDISSATASQFAFTDTSGNSITYSLSGSSLMRNSQVLADGISNLALTYFDLNGASTSTPANIRYITISLTITQGNTNFSVATSVYPRNLI